MVFRLAKAALVAACLNAGTAFADPVTELVCDLAQGKEVKVDGPCCELASMIPLCANYFFRGILLRCGGAEEQGYWRVSALSTEKDQPKWGTCWASPSVVTIEETKE
jgi:hypothetical protein